LFCATALTISKISEGFRQFSLQGSTIIISFSDFSAKDATQTIPPLWNRNLASEPLYLRSLEVGIYFFFCGHPDTNRPAETARAAIAPNITRRT